MADKLFKVNEAIEVGYQAPNKESGLVYPNAPMAVIYNPSGGVHATIGLTEVGATGTYAGQFTPNVEGSWKVLLSKFDGDAQVVKAYSVGAKNIQDIYLDTAKDSTVAKDNTVAKSADLANVDTKVTNIENIVSALDTPPMAF